MTCEDETALGAYVLGALDKRERERVDEHVAECTRCRAELEALIPVRAYLARLAPEELNARPSPVPSPSPRPLARLRLHRTLLAGGAVAAAALLALIAGSRGDDGPSTLAAARSSAADARTGVRVSVAATSRAWGTELRVRMSGAAPGERCRLVVRARDGHSDVAATWWTTDGGSAEVTGSAAIEAADLVALDVVTAGGHQLVHVPMTK